MFIKGRSDVIQNMTAVPAKMRVYHHEISQAHGSGDKEGRVSQS